MIFSTSTNDSSGSAEGSAETAPAPAWIDADSGDVIATAREAVMQLESGNSLEAAPTTLFRLALVLRHSGNLKEASVLFQQSGRMLTEQYMNQRLHLRRRGA
jgi:hypothetical protein